MSLFGKIFGCGRFVNLIVVAGMILLALVLGILNNLRVYEEQRVSWLGDDESAEEVE